MPPIIPPTGLIGAEQSTVGGLNAALQALGAGIGSARTDISQGVNQALQPIQGFQGGGVQAQQMQAALSGAAGMPAQQQAFNQFQMSPAQQFLQQESERALVRNAAATGGVGGNNLRRALSRDAMRFGSQAINDQFNQLGQVANRGFQAAGAASGIQQRGAENLANLSLQGGTLPASMITGAAENVAGRRFGTGQQLAQAIGGTASNLANLQNQAGTGQANITGQTGTNLANLVSGTGQAQSQLQQQLATILANIGTQGASSLAAPTQAAGQFDAAGILGQNTAVQNAISDLVQLIPSGSSTTVPSGTDVFGTGTQSI